MSPFDPKNPPDWVKRMLDRAATAKGEHFHAELNEGRGGSPAISLGAGTYVAPLPVGWSLHPARHYEGRLRVKEGHDISYRIDSYEDPEAAKAGARLLDYADEPEFRCAATTPADVLKGVLISIPGRDPAGKDIVWKCVEPLGGTHVRELVLRCPLVAAELIEHRESIARAVGEWMGLGRFAPEPTPLDRAAHTAALERVNFDDTVLMRVPRGWKVAVDSEEEGRKLYAVDEPRDRETIWVTSRLLGLPDYDDPRVPRAFLAKIVDQVWKGFEADTRKRWITKRREELDDGEILLVTANEEEERGDTLRRITWIRYAVRDDAIVWAPIHLVTASRFLDEPAQIETEALVDREVRNAILVPPVGEDGAGRASSA